MYPSFVRYEYTIIKPAFPIPQLINARPPLIPIQRDSSFEMIRASFTNGVKSVEPREPPKPKKQPLEARQESYLNSKQRSVQLLLEIQDIIGSTFQPTQPDIQRLQSLRQQLVSLYDSYRDTPEQEASKQKILLKLDSITRGFSPQRNEMQNSREAFYRELNKQFNESSLMKYQSPQTERKKPRQASSDLNRTVSRSPPPDISASIHENSFSKFKHRIENSDQHETDKHADGFNSCDFFKNYQRSKSQFLRKSFEERTKKDIQNRQEKLLNYQKFLKSSAEHLKGQQSDSKYEIEEYLDQVEPQVEREQRMKQQIAANRSHKHSQSQFIGRVEISPSDSQPPEPRDPVPQSTINQPYLMRPPQQSQSQYSPNTYIKIGKIEKLMTEKRQSSQQRETNNYQLLRSKEEPAKEIQQALSSMSLKIQSILQNRVQQSNYRSQPKVSNQKVKQTSSLLLNKRHERAFK